MSLRLLCLIYLTLSLLQLWSDIQYAPPHNKPVTVQMKWGSIQDDCCNGEGCPMKMKFNGQVGPDKQGHYHNSWGTPQKPIEQ